MPIKCPHCGREFPGDRLNARHLAKCNPTASPDVLPCLCGHESTSLTQMKRHRRSCDVWRNRDKQAVQQARTEASFEQKYGEGVTNARHIPEAEERRKATVQERYGADNVFSRESTLFDQVQASLEGKRPVFKGEDNPFSRPEVQEKIRQHWEQEHGVHNPQQVPEVRARTKATHIERYGGELLGSPEVAAKVRATNLERYGDEFPQRTDEVKARIVETNEARFGVPWTSMDPEVRAKQLETMEATYGSHFFASEEGKGIVRSAMLEAHGVEFPGQMEGHWGKVLATFHENYPGVAWPGMLARRVDGPNKLEQRVWDLAPNLMFTGDGSFWRWLPAQGAYKNPDFILPGPDPAHPLRGVTKVVECFGDFWHGRMKTGKAGFKHEQELVDAFAEVGLDCLVVWETQVDTDPEEVGDRLRAFLG